MEMKDSRKDGGKNALIKLLSSKTSMGERMRVLLYEMEKNLQPYSDSHEGFNSCISVL